MTASGNLAAANDSVQRLTVTPAVFCAAREGSTPCAIRASAAISSSHSVMSSAC